MPESGRLQSRHRKFGLGARSAGRRAVMQRLLGSRRGKTTLRTGHDCVFTWTRDTAIAAIELAAAPLPIQALPGDTQFAQKMPELGRQHRYMGAAPNPRILTGWFGASSHGLWFPVRAFLRFPVCPAGLFPFVRLPPVSLRLALSGSVPSAVAVRFGSPSVSLRVPFPLSNLHVSAAARRFCGRWSRAAGTKVTSSRRDPWL